MPISQTGVDQTQPVGRLLPGRVVLACLLLLGTPLLAPVSARAESWHGTTAVGVGSASLRQQGLLTFRVSTKELRGPASLEPKGGLHLCLELFRGRLASPRREVCVRSRSGRPGMKLVSYGLDPGGKVISRKFVPASFHGRNTSVLTRFLPSDALIRPGKWRWVVASRASDDNCASAQPPCEVRFPSGSGRPITVRTPRRSGCKAAGSTFRRNGPRGRKQIALTFDDGPGPYTSSILRVLEQLDAKATFFVLGNRVAGRQGVLRQILHEGHELANHSWNHALLAGGGRGAYDQIRHTNAVIRSATGFTPCMFRPPYGAVSGSLVAEAHRVGLATTAWDVDPRDWATPGAGTISARVVGSARSGSIVVMHDGGEQRRQTVQAVAAIIKRLRARGYELVTVSQLLGFKQLYR